MFFQLGFPGRKTFEQTPDDLARAQKLISKFNGITHIFRTIYNFTGIPSSQNAVVDKLFFDFDICGGQELLDLRTLHEEFESMRLSHRMYFSGNGFHLFLKAQPVYAQATPLIRRGVKSAFNYFKDLVDVEPDPKTKDLMRFARLPNTINIKSGRYCIPLTAEEIYYTRNEIEKLAKTSRNIDNNNPGKEIDIQEYCTGDMLEVEFHSSEGLSSLGTNLSDDIPRCVLFALKQGDCGYDQRYAVITALRDLGYSQEETQSILKKYLSTEKYNHCVFEEDQVTYLYEAHPDYIFPSCRTLREEYDMCVEGCGGQQIYFEDLIL
jgi:hypothetical protein